MRLPGHRTYLVTVPDTLQYRHRLVAAMVKTGALVSVLPLGKEMSCRVSILPSRLNQFKTALSPLQALTVEGLMNSTFDSVDPSGG
jgi:hypothetical protein